MHSEWVGAWGRGGPPSDGRYSSNPPLASARVCASKSSTARWNGRVNRVLLRGIPASKPSTSTSSACWIISSTPSIIVVPAGPWGALLGQKKIIAEQMSGWGVLARCSSITYSAQIDYLWLRTPTRRYEMTMRPLRKKKKHEMKRKYILMTL